MSSPTSGLIPMGGAPIPGINLSSTYGALFISNSLICALWGINVMQAYFYYWNYEDDTWMLKAIVAIILVVDSLPKFFISRELWTICVKQWGNPEILGIFDTDGLHLFWIGYLAIAMVQVYYIWRIAKFASTSRFNRTYWFRLCFVFLVAVYLAQIALAMVFVTKGFKESSITALDVYNLSKAFIMANSIIDVTIAIYMLLLLRECAPTLTRTSHIIRRLSLIIVNTGLLTAICSVITVILEFAYKPEDLWYAIGGCLLGPLYVTSFLANLNARAYVRGEDIITSAITNTGNYNTARNAREKQARAPGVLSSIQFGSRPTGTNTTGSIAINMRESLHVAVDEELPKQGTTKTSENA